MYFFYSQGAVTIDPSELDFGVVELKTSVSQYLTIKNNSLVPVKFRLGPFNKPWLLPALPDWRCVHPSETNLSFGSDG